jgi:hypothetical protein
MSAPRGYGVACLPASAVESAGGRKPGALGDASFLGRRKLPHEHATLS